MAFSRPQWGWVDWQFYWDGDQAKVHVSYLNDWADVWVWMAALAHGVCPSTLRLDEEGSQVELGAQWRDASRDVIHLSLRRLSDDEPPVEMNRFDWLDDRSCWLRHLGQALSERMADFPPRHWGYPSALWVPIESRLPWHVPGQVSKSGWSSSQGASWQQGWLFLVLASGLDVMQGLEQMPRLSAVPRPLLEAMVARLKYLEILLRARALKAAQMLLGLPDVSGEALHRHWRDRLVDVFDDVDDVFATKIDWENVADGLHREMPMALLAQEATQTSDFSFQLSGRLKESKRQAVALMDWGRNGIARVFDFLGAIWCDIASAR
jgi:hypothetical protein